MIVRFLITLVILYLLYRVVKSVLHSSKEKSSIQGGRVMNMEDLVEDPQCHAYVPKSSAYESTIAGKRVYFCSEKCCDMYKNESSQEETK